jgi:hypothetical protein
MLTLLEREEKIRNAPITYEGSKYAPVPHSVIMDLIEEECYSNNLIIGGKSFRTSRSNQRLVADYTINTDLDSEIGYMLSFKNSTDGSMSVGIASGTKTFICENGSVYGDSFSFKRKHFSSKDILSGIRKAIESLEQEMTKQINRKNSMKLIPLTKTEMSQLAGRLYIEEGLLLTNQMTSLKSEIIKPSFDYDAPETVWEFYSHLTHVIKTTSPLHYHNTYKKTGDFIINNFELV